ncbi:hypothetical protein [Pseudonocardia alni]|uniref:hypothetical protein n=1 Tax=Pseudonocardia alni TaxID=33907 RepID=UPI0027A7DD85|nr:hypothetical protein PaSha_09410 [Pseudonocardia alni]
MADEPVLAITPDDSLLHVGTPAALLTHLGDEADGGDGQGPPFEFYDRTGRRLSVAPDAAGGASLTADGPAPTDADRDLLLARIDVFQAAVARLLAHDVATGIAAGDPSARLRAPWVRGELPDVLDTLAVLGGLPDPTEPNAGTPLHNLWHRVFG